ncbi:amidase domain-containing protein [Tumebacillus avium]|uniref:amidase domain-containing protein n=1 Tax=Tumebacillus avium TaxID=1903704 RepID=UPI0012FE0830|nr:amidase domain-containing protein [Tumebacillus avium]
MKKKALFVTLIGASLLTSPAYAGNYTNSDPNANSGYNRTVAKQYAETYAVYPNSAYFDYTDAGGDCTNFISQVLFHGGLTENKVFSAGGILSGDIRSWYYDGADIPLRSKSWTGAHEFRYHWGNVNGNGFNRAYQYKVYTYAEAYNNFNTIYTDLWPGDIVQYVRSDGLTYHTQVVHGFSSSDLLVAQHTTNKKNSYLKQTLAGYAYSDGWLVTYRIKQATNY